MNAAITVAWWFSVAGAWLAASSKGRRGWAYALLAALVPIIGLVVALVVPDKTSGYGQPKRTTGWGA